MRIDLDPDSGVVEEHFSIIYAPRRNRDRFPENSVHIVDSKEEAIAQADENKKQYAAVVVGPSRSSEGLRLYYLVEWL